MGTDWAHTSSIADGFDAYDDLPERALGYPTVFERLGLKNPDVRKVVDYGCGPGKVALRIAEAYDVDVLAADISPQMLHIANARRPHPRIRYHQLDATRLAAVTDGSIDAVLCCYVFINVADRREIAAIVAEAYRVLRPGGRFAVLDTNPDTTGTEFSTFRSGEPGRVYKSGEQRRVLLRLPDGGVLELRDHHWPRETYVDVLGAAGFRQIAVSEPLLGDVSNSGAVVPGSLLDLATPAETTHPPFLISVGVR